MKTKADEMRYFSIMIPSKRLMSQAKMQVYIETSWKCTNRLTMPVNRTCQNWLKMFVINYVSSDLDTHAMVHF